MRAVDVPTTGNGRNVNSEYARHLLQVQLMSDLDTLPSRLREIRAVIRDEYLQPHGKPWIVGYSGGKDSTLLVHLVVETLLHVAPDERRRSVYILSNDTLVESPVYQDWVNQSLKQLREGLSALRLPVEVVQTRPDEEWTFWVNLLGRGYPAPNRMFRWCTDKMKIRPTTQFMRERISASGEVILLLGVRRAESAARAQRIDLHSETAVQGGRLHPHTDVKGCFIFRPLIDLSDTDVWHILLNGRSPWGGEYRKLVTLYRNAQGGECPFVVTDNDAPSCGSTSGRFGCWTCTVVQKDNSISGLIDAGFDFLEPLAEFRERIKAVSENPDHRSKIRRNGQPGLGPLTVEARQMLLRELLQIQDETGLSLISEHEVRLIKDWWGRDETTAILREADRLIQLTVGGKANESSSVL